MQVHVFTDTRFPRAVRPNDVAGAIRAVADGTDTAPLIVAAYLVKGMRRPHGHYVTAWRTPADFARQRGRWASIDAFGVPPGLPDRFRLIRLRLNPRARYPRADLIRPGWTVTCGGLVADVACLFAHELHHYRRYHLGLHPREGELSAWKWAIGRCDELGHDIRSDRRPVPRSAPRRRRALRPEVEAHYDALRRVPDGAPVRVMRDNGRGRYAGGVAEKLRTPRRGAYRMPVRTPDGREWYWPMQWLAPMPELDGSDER